MSCASVCHQVGRLVRPDVEIEQLDSFAHRCRRTLLALLLLSITFGSFVFSLWLFVTHGNVGPVILNRFVPGKSCQGMSRAHVTKLFETDNNFFPSAYGFGESSKYQCSFTFEMVSDQQCFERSASLSNASLTMQLLNTIATCPQPGTSNLSLSGNMIGSLPLTQFPYFNSLSCSFTCFSDSSSACASNSSALPGGANTVAAPFLIINNQICPPVGITMGPFFECRPFQAVIPLPARILDCVCNPLSQCQHGLCVPVLARVLSKPGAS
jgi:hypothetical protein